MKKFLKPTKMKLFLAILLLFLTSFLATLLLSFYGMGDSRICLTNLPGTPIPTPTPAPFSISLTLNDLKDSFCLGNDPSAQVATAIIDTTHISKFVLFVLLNYLLSCIIVFFITKLKNQIKNITVKSKK